MADKTPTFTPGERVTLAGDKRAWPWVVVETFRGGAIRIQREGSEPSIYTQMYALPHNLKKASPR